MKTHHSNTKKKSQKLAAAVATALSYMSKAQAVLPIDDDLIARDRKALQGLVKFPTEALQAASEILASEPELLASFDASAVNDSLAYEVGITKVLQQIEALRTSLQQSLLKRRAPGIEQTLALYAWLKRGGQRVDGSLAKYADALKPHVAIGGRKKAKASPTPEPQPPAPPAGTTIETPPSTATATPPVASPNGASAPATTH